MTSRIDIAESMRNPEGLVQVSTKLLPNPKGRYFFVKMLNGADEFKAGAYALVNLIGEAKDGDRVLVNRGEGSTMAVMKLKRMKDGWSCVPLKKSRLTPMFLDSIDEAVLGVVERVFDIEI